MGYNAAFHWGKLEEDRLSSRTHIRTNAHSCIQWSECPYTQTRTHICRNDGMLSHRLGGPIDCCTLWWESVSLKMNPTDKTDNHTQDIVAKRLIINRYAYSWLQLSRSLKGTFIIIDSLLCHSKSECCNFFSSVQHKTYTCLKEPSHSSFTKNNSH